MTDKELLELAAKASGMEIEVDALGNRLVVNRCGNTLYASTSGWNPLTDDGDALRLAVKLKINLSIIGKYDNEVLAYSAMHHYDEEPSEIMDNNPYAATRRAIVRAAAEIGKGMK